MISFLTIKIASNKVQSRKVCFFFFCYFLITSPEHNTHIHKPKNDIDAMIKWREYRGIHLTLYSPEFNIIEQFWALLKNTVKRSKFGNADDLKTRITEVS